MKPKEIIIIVSGVLVIGICVYFGYTLLFGSGEKPQEAQNTQTQNTVPSNIDETTYKTVNTLSDYGKPPLLGLGKPDLFASY